MILPREPNYKSPSDTMLLCGVKGYALSLFYDLTQRETEQNHACGTDSNVSRHILTCGKKTNH